MSEHHRINLSNAWEPPSEGSRAWVRRFGTPSGVAPGDRVWLLVEGGVAATLVLNGVCLSAETGRHDVTALLEPRNELLLVPSAAEVSPALSHGRCGIDPQYGQVRLEIETNE